MLSGGLLTKGAATTVKGLNRVQKFSEAVGETRPGQLVKLVNSKRATVNRKVIGGLAKGSKKVAGPALSRAKTVGKTIRLYRLRKQVDVDAGDLSTKQEENLGSYLDAAGSDGADYINGLSPEQRRDFLTLAPCDRYSAASGASATSSLPRDCDLTASQRDQAYEQFHRADDPYKVQQKVRGLDSDTREEVLDFLSVVRGPEADTAVWMLEGLSDDRIEYLVKNGYDLSIQVDILHIYRKSDVEIKQKGDIGEIVAEETILERKYSDKGRILPKEDSKGVEIELANEISYGDDSFSEQEWDHFVIDENGDVIYIMETKITPGVPDKAEKQLTRAAKMKDVDSNEIVEIKPDQSPTNEITVSDFQVDESRAISIGPTSDYDEQLPFTNDQLVTARENINKIEDDD